MGTVQILACGNALTQGDGQGGSELALGERPRQPEEDDRRLSISREARPGSVGSPTSPVASGKRSVRGDTTRQRLGPAPRRVNESLLAQHRADADQTFERIRDRVQRGRRVLVERTVLEPPVGGLLRKGPVTVPAGGDDPGRLVEGAAGQREPPRR